MDLRNLALLRFDFLLGEESDDMVSEFEEHFGDPPNQVSWRDIRDNEQVELTFEVEPGQLGLPSEFDSITVRVIESTDAITEIITLATIDVDQIDNDDSEENTGINFVQRQDWERRLENIRTYIPGEEHGPETTVFWAKFDSLPDELEEEPVDLETAHDALSEEEPSNILESFNVSTSGGIVLLDEDTMILTRDPSRWWGSLFAIDLGENLSPTDALDGLQLHGPWPALSTLYGIHFWSRLRGIELDEFEDGLEEADTELPSGNDVEVDEYLDLDATIYELQEEWVSLNSRISRELRQLSRRLDILAVRIDEMSRSQLQSTPASEGIGPLESYMQQLENELDRVEFDSSRLNERLNSLSTVFHNRVSMIATRENIDLQERVSDQTDQSLVLQSRVFWFTLAVGVLTMLLVIDAFSSGGLAIIIDRIFDDGLAAVTFQMMIGLSVILIGIAIVLPYIKWQPIAQRVTSYFD